MQERAIFCPEQKSIIECSECHELIKKNTSYYVGQTQQHTDYYCCTTCYKELGSSGRLKVLKLTLKLIEGEKYLCITLYRSIIDSEEVKIVTTDALVDIMWSKLRNAGLAALVDKLNSPKSLVVSPSDLSNIFHSQGVNLYFLGDVYSQVKYFKLKIYIG